MGIYSNNPDYWRGQSFAGPKVKSSPSMFLTDEQNNIVRKWVPKVQRLLKSNARTMFPDGKESWQTKRPKVHPVRVEKKLARSITSATRQSAGEIYAVTFSFERHGVFVHKGVSRGHPVSNPRVAFEWFNPVLEKYIPELADKIAAVNANAAVNATRMKIN